MKSIIGGLAGKLKLFYFGQPEMGGRVMVLTDNSGSAWGTIPSEYGKVTVAEIDNLSAVITAMKAEEGYEWRRLFYVAYTRASSLMILPFYEKTASIRWKLER